MPSHVDVDDKTFSSEQLLDQEEIDELSPINKFFHQVITMVFDIYSLLIINLFSQLDNIVSNAILDDSSDSAKKQTQDFPTVIGDVFKLLKNHHVTDSILKHIFLVIFHDHPGMAENKNRDDGYR